MANSSKKRVLRLGTDPSVGAHIGAYRRMARAAEAVVMEIAARPARREFLRGRNWDDEVRLTQRQQAFVREYLLDLNAAQAAVRAGYSAACAKEQGARLLTYAHIRSEIDRAMNERARRTEVAADRVLGELARIAFYDPRKLFSADGSPKELDAIDEDSRCAIVSIDTRETPYGAIIRRVKLGDKLRALEMLGRHLGLFNERSIAGDCENPIAILIQKVQGNALRPIAAKDGKHRDDD